MSNDVQEVLADFIAADTEELLKDTKINKSDVILILTREEAKIFIHKSLMDKDDSGILAEEHMLVGTAIVMRLREEVGFFKKMLDWTINKSGMEVFEGNDRVSQDDKKYN